MVRLPDRFLEWNYYPRRRLIQEMLVGGARVSPERLALEFTRHNPVLVTAAPLGGGIRVNGKVVGCGYVPRRERIAEAVRAFEEHIRASDEAYEEARGDREALRKLYVEHAERGARLMLRHIYLPRGEAEGRVDFEKLATVELAMKETWRLVQLNRTASLVFFQPPTVSFEVKGRLTVHVGDEYHRVVTLIHDAYHYTPPERRGERPVYILHVEEVYDKSATPSGFGKRIA